MKRLIVKTSRMKTGLALFGLGLLLVPLFWHTKSTSRLTVRVTGARNANGEIGLLLFDDATGFPQNVAKAIYVVSAEIDPQTLSTEAVFDIPRGTYAVSVFHDENMNGDIDQNFGEGSKEGYGTSNNPRKRMGRPTFDEAKFSADQPEQLVEIKLMY